MSTDTVTRFYRHHNKNAVFSEDNTVAYINLKESLANGLTIFSEKPLQPTEIFLIEIEQNERWDDHVRLTLTTLAPQNVPGSLICKWYLSGCIPHFPDFGLNGIGRYSIYDIPKIRNRDFRYNSNRLATSLDMLTDENNIVMTRNGHVRLQMLRPSNKNVGISATNTFTRVGIMYIPTSDTQANIHHIINGEDQGADRQDIAYTENPLYVKIDVCDTIKKIRIIQLYEVPTLQSACRDAILQCTTKKAVSSLPLPTLLKKYLLYK